MREIIFAGQVNSSYVFSNFAKSNKKNKEPKRNLIKGAAYLGGSGYVGQQAIRSGVPRLLGVRLESHSTSRKSAKEILKNGGWLDPNKSGTGAIRNLEAVEGTKGVTNASSAGKKVYITGVHENAQSRKIPGMGVVNPKKENPLIQVLQRKEQRAGYRGQADIDWEYVNKDKTRISELENDITTSKNTKKTIFNNKPKDKVNTPAKQKELAALREGNKTRLLKEKTKAIGRGLMPWKGKSLYIGGGDEYFNKNFKPDFDDVRAMYSEDKIKMSGSRAGATLEALKREGGGSRLKGIARLVKANPSRALAGAGILAGGGLLTAKLGQAAYRNLTAPSDGKVKGFSRKNKSGKWSNVKSFIRDKIKK